MAAQEEPDRFSITRPSCYGNNLYQYLFCSVRYQEGHFHLYFSLLVFTGKGIKLQVTACNLGALLLCWVEVRIQVQDLGLL